MYYANIKYCDIANGPGVRTSLFVSGCTHRCPGCFNEVAWDFGYGAPFTKEVRNQIFASCQPDYIAGLSLLGGEPMEPVNQRELLPFVRNFKALYPHKTVWCYSGYTLEQLLGQEPSRCRCEATDPLLALLDVLVDGPFVQAEYDISLRFRGSANQRLLDMPCVSGAAPTSACWTCPAPSPPANPSSGRTSPSFPPIRWIDFFILKALQGGSKCSSFAAFSQRFICSFTRARGKSSGRA